MRPPVDINSLPFPDWDLFEPEAIYRPMQGKVWRAVGVETQRGVVKEELKQLQCHISEN